MYLLKERRKREEKYEAAIDINNTVLSDGNRGCCCLRNT